MKRLTYNRLAGAGLRAHGRQYVSLGLSVFLSVYLVASLCVAASGLFQKQRDNAALRVGYLNAFFAGLARMDGCGAAGHGIF